MMIEINRIKLFTPQPIMNIYNYETNIASLKKEYFLRFLRERSKTK